MDTLQTITNWAQIIALPVAVVAIILSIIFYRRTRHRAALSCTFDSLERPVEIKSGPGLAGDIGILYRGQKVDNLYVARARIRNTGNVPIRASDVVKPLTFTFSPKAILLDQPRTTDPHPADLRLDWSVEAPNAPSLPTATVKFDLLNPGDDFTVEFVYTGDPAVPVVSAHIVGMPTIMSTDLTRDPTRDNAYLAGGVLALGTLGAWLLLMADLAAPSANPAFRWGPYWVAGTVLLAFLVSVIILTVRLYRTK